MAVRRATRRYEDIDSFLADREGSLRSGAILLPPDTVDGELAPEIKLDLVLPLVGRVGPITAQVVHRSPNGTAMQLPRLEREAGAKLAEFDATLSAVEAWLLSSGRVVPAPDEGAEADAAEPDEAPDGDEVEALRARIAELEAALAAVASGAPVAEVAAPAAAPAEPGVRGLPVPDLGDRPPDEHGEVGGRAFREALMQLTARRATGLMTIQTPDGPTRYGFWKLGGPVAWRTDPIVETEVLGVLLFKAGQLTKEQLQESLDKMEAQGVRQGEALMDMGLVGFSQLTMILGKQCEFVLSKVLKQEGGTWTFHDLADLPEQFLPPPLRVPTLLFRGLVARSKQMPSTELAAFLRPLIDQYVKFDERLRPLLSEIKFNAAEAKLVKTMQANNWRTREVLSVSPLSKQNTAGIILALVEIGFLVFDQKEDRARYVRRVTEMVEEKRRHLLKATHFDVLEVHWISLPREIELGYKRLAEKFDLKQYNDLPPDIVDSFAYINQRMKESYDYLRNDQQRREHRKSFIEAMMIVQSAELLAKKGEMAIMRKDRRESTLCFAKALELVPGRPDFREGLQRASAIVGT